MMQNSECQDLSSRLHPFPFLALLRLGINTPKIFIFNQNNNPRLNDITSWLGSVWFWNQGGVQRSKPSCYNSSPRYEFVILRRFTRIGKYDESIAVIQTIRFIGSDKILQIKIISIKQNYLFGILRLRIIIINLHAKYYNISTIWCFQCFFVIYSLDLRIKRKYSINKIFTQLNRNSEY